MEYGKYVCPKSFYKHKEPAVCPACKVPLIANCPVCGDPMVGEHVTWKDKANSE